MEKNDLVSIFKVGVKAGFENGRPALDEVAATGPDVHLEQMDYDRWWMGIQSGGNGFNLWFTLEDGRLCVRLSE